MTYIESPPAGVCPETPPTREERDARHTLPADDRSLVAAVAARSGLQNQLYVRYRRPLLQVFLHRRIARDAAEDLLQRTFLQAVKKIRTEGLDDPSNLGGYLYRTACKLAAAYWRGELARQYDTDGERLTSIQDEALSIEERLEHEQLAQCVRELMSQLAVPRDREVLERYYLHEESRVAIRESLQLTEMQFNQVLWRARQRFGEILRRHGLASSEPGAAPLPQA
ncbi:MAG TPA: sigma-70 family RNA polymerase sigma factor [Steroidobacteraceae bacterium]